MNKTLKKKNSVAFSSLRYWRCLPAITFSNKCLPTFEKPVPLLIIWKLRSIGSYYRHRGTIVEYFVFFCNDFQLVITNFLLPLSAKFSSKKLLSSQLIKLQVIKYLHRWNSNMWHYKWNCWVIFSYVLFVFSKFEEIIFIVFVWLRFLSCFIRFTIYT